MIVHSKEITFVGTLKTVFAGNYASNFLPSTIGGDTVRIIGAARLVGWSVSMASVVVDRVTNVFAMVCFFPIIWKVFPSLAQGLGSGNGLLPNSNWALAAGLKSSFPSKIIQYEDFKHMLQKGSVAQAMIDGRVFHISVNKTGHVNCMHFTQQGYLSHTIQSLYEKYRKGEANLLN